MTDYKCAARGANFLSQTGMWSQPVMKVTEESHHYSNKSAHGQIELILLDQAWEQPTIFAQELRTAFESLR